MKLILENIGSIKKGEIDLDRDFYVFVGKNNSGKTYISQILWEFLARLDDLRKDITNDFEVSYLDNSIEEILKQGYVNITQDNLNRCVLSMMYRVLML